ncbi:hypothetical protein R1sor_017336 [Riccia sorocarpa]|uniref:Peroxidase n=1 Tax=Riccia sorocarpa TaxID=122646 RepID=A0ABD3I9X3_9MARC
MTSEGEHCRKPVLLLALISCTLFLAGGVNGLYPGFYSYSCPNVESIVRETLKTFLDADRTLKGPLFRVTYHDCFVRGCDASLLLNSVDGNTAEKDAVGPNKNSIRGYEVYDGIKAALEKACPGVVSCADIIQLVARDIIVLDGGPYWDVPTGRRDGRVSIASESLAELVSPNSDYDTQKASFAKHGLSEKELVVLTGAHTIGRARCATFANRLYNFSGSGQADPTLDPSYAEKLRKRCPVGSTKSVQLDGTQFHFDTRYYHNVLENKGLFHSDASFLTQSFPKSIVELETDQNNFFVDFPSAMTKMSSIGVLLGYDGEIRKNCAFVN